MKLIPLNEIPAAARSGEATARHAFASRADATVAAECQIVAAEGCHSRPYFDPPTVGWVLTRQAAEAYTAQVARMPDGTTHRRAACPKLERESCRHCGASLTDSLARHRRLHPDEPDPAPYCEDDCAILAKEGGAL